MTASQSEPHQTAAATVQTVYVFRHAEKVADKPDPELSEQGQRRAKNLAQLLKHSGIKRIYATKYQRTQQTAMPVAEHLHLAVNTYAAGDSVDLSHTVRAHGETTLIVGHSNTVPDIVAALGGEAHELSEQDYGDLFIVHIVHGQATTLRLYVSAD